MMQKLWLKKPKLNYSKEVIDIVQFGSSVIENKEPRDIDISVIFKKIPIKEQLLESQKIKRQLEKLSNKSIHINSFDLYSLFDNSNFARSGILFLGRSIFTGNYFSERFGLTPKIHIYYSLINLKKKDKIRFNYLLSGRGGNYGLLRKYEGNLLKPGLIEISPEFEGIFVNSMDSFDIEFKVRKVFLQGISN